MLGERCWCSGRRVVLYIGWLELECVLIVVLSICLLVQNSLLRRKVDDIGDVADVVSDDDNKIVKLVVVGEIDGVLSVEECMSCIACSAKIKVLMLTLCQ